MNALVQLSDSDMRGIESALRTGRLAPPYSEVAVRRFVNPLHATAVASQLTELASQGFTALQASVLLEALGSIRDLSNDVNDLVEVVTTGPESAGSPNRDTSVVVRDLFAGATHSVLVAGYAVHQGRRIFSALASRMEATPGLSAKLFLDIKRGHGETTADEELVRRFAVGFVSKEWPLSSPLPEVYYFPASLASDTRVKSVMHAKCIVVDEATTFVGSANFTDRI